MVVAYLDDATRFRTARQVSAYAGLVPRQFQSGEMDRRGRITRRGPRLLRKVLVEAAWMMQRYNDWAVRMLKRISKGPGRTVEYWQPHIIGKHYKLRYEHRTGQGGTHASPRGHWVSGFWREQPHGPQRSLRKTLWIEPFWRGGKTE